jgi:hypothetical protein
MLLCSDDPSLGEVWLVSKMSGVDDGEFLGHKDDRGCIRKKAHLLC